MTWVVKEMGTEPTKLVVSGNNQENGEFQIHIQLQTEKTINGEKLYSYQSLGKLTSKGFERCKYENCLKSNLVGLENGNWLVLVEGDKHDF